MNDANKILKQLMREEGFSITRMGTVIGVNGKTLSRRLALDNPTFDSVAQVLGVLGYEIVIQKKRASGRRAATQHVITSEAKQ